MGEELFTGLWAAHLCELWNSQASACLGLLSAEIVRHHAWLKVNILKEKKCKEQMGATRPPREGLSLDLRAPPPGDWRGEGGRNELLGLEREGPGGLRGCWSWGQE